MFLSTLASRMGIINTHTPSSNQFSQRISNSLSTRGIQHFASSTRTAAIKIRLLLNRPVWSRVSITFDEDDFQVRDFPHTDAFVATANIAGFTVHILIDNGSSTDILFIKPFEQMRLDK